MRREATSNFLSFLFSLLFFLSINEKSQARKLQQVVMCSSSCGDVKNISYPFRLKSDRAACGDPDFELSCQSNKTILKLGSGEFYVKKILYAEQLINVVDVNLANGSCGLPHKSLSQAELLDGNNYRFQYFNNYTEANFVRCSSNISNRPDYRRLPCSNQYVNYGGHRISEIPKSCSFISVVPLRKIPYVNPSYEAIMKSIESGFYLLWSVECRDCISHGGSCVFSNTYEEQYYYFCGTYFTYELLKIIISIRIVVLLVIFLLVVLLLSRFIIAIGLIVFLIHKYMATRKKVDQVEKFLHNQQSWMPKRYSFIEIMATTNHFRDKLGQGGFGTVYKGQLVNGRSIAVKVLENSKFNGEEFINEVSTLGRIHHSNVVRLLGFCSEGSKRALVYEYMHNGSLDKYIFVKRGIGQTFNWEKLYEIALGIARGIKYLHEGCDVCILHFDIKPHNILLDHNFIPKVADFGLAKFYPKENDFVSVSALRGTIGYIAPELISRNFGEVSSKSDVYSFGMLLLEMAGRRRNSYGKATRSSKAYFPSWVYDQIIKGGDLELHDASEIESTMARQMCMIGLWCIQVKAIDRPSITKVVEMLEGSIDDLQMPPKPFFSSSSSQHDSIREIQSDSSTELLESKSIEECSYNDM
ncbi:hypothetical protein Ddye_030082 [Dipteronia dyeriana]|uniref:non-specific serine/threonine protein kinase n=1 Tax=Dipteronia dyeriana TaxID=168575 RepID=A0AAD9TGY4_9ROSI|nr:hypothetical protein Ddye_030082 [Dipteronia dyeriana]